MGSSHIQAVTLTLVLLPVVTGAAGRTKTGQIFLLMDPVEARERIATPLVRRVLHLDDDQSGEQEEEAR
jgi:hypothetical protein